MTFQQLCRTLNLRAEHIAIYKKWLIKHHGLDDETLYTSKKKFLMRGLVVPPPQGAQWRSFKRSASERQAVNHGRPSARERLP